MRLCRTTVICHRPRLLFIKTYDFRVRMAVGWLTVDFEQLREEVLQQRSELPLVQDVVAVFVFPADAKNSRESVQAQNQGGNPAQKIRALRKNILKEGHEAE